MASFSIGTHVHTNAAFGAILLTILTYAVKWVFGLSLPTLIFMVPTFIAFFLGYYLILWVVFFIVWSRR
jgi:hypothetical protein